MTERLTCKKDCDYWNEYDQDCEFLGENHPCPRKCRIFKEKYPEKFPNKKCKKSQNIQCKKCKVAEQLDKAEWTLKSIAVNLTTDPADMRVIFKDWCCDQVCLNLVNKYFEGKEAK